MESTVIYGINIFYNILEGLFVIANGIFMGLCVR